MTPSQALRNAALVVGSENVFSTSAAISLENSLELADRSYLKRGAVFPEAVALMARTHNKVSPLCIGLSVRQLNPIRREPIWQESSLAAEINERSRRDSQRPPRIAG